MNKVNLKKAIVAAILVTAGTAANADEVSTGRVALNSIFFKLAHTMMEKTEAPVEKISVAPAMAKSARLAQAKRKATASVQVKTVSING